mmetsp:Transcript_22855/g.26052  ORF Transcript_22855/g.26052 Transcript_22855/m.26052 type:complete len:322 (-) Transcript_22855:114-1079(-)
MTIYKFRPRYTSKDTSSVSPGNDSYSVLWSFSICCFRAGCSSKIRFLISTITMLALWVATNNVSSIIGIIESQSPLQAHRQSYGYVDLPKWKWRSLKEHYKRVHSTPRNTVFPSSPVGVSTWYKSNVGVDFTCSEEHLLLDYWWICNPRHLNLKRRCTVYSSGPPNSLAVEHALEELLPSCEIHLFDPLNKAYTGNVLNKKIRASRIQSHPWGFAERERKGSNSFNVTIDLNTIKGTMKKLGHSQVDLLLLYCNGCEWTLDFSEIQQVLVVVKGIQNMDWFGDMNKNNYVLFHKEPIEVFGTAEKYHLLCYLKLRKAFFSS